MTRDLIIAALGRHGEGIAETDSGPVYVPYTLPGETVFVAGEGKRARLIEIVEPSPARVAPHCPHFTRCGGCAVQHWRGPDYLAWKRGLVVTALRHRRLDAAVAEAVAETIDAHGDGRRRVTVHVQFPRGRVSDRIVIDRTPDQLRESALNPEDRTDSPGSRIARGDPTQPGSVLAGFMAARSHRLLDLDACPILEPGLSSAMAIARALAAPLAALGKPLDMAMTATETGIDCDIRGRVPFEPDRQLALSEAAGSLDLARLTLNGEPVIERRRPMLRAGKATIALPPGAFTQATAAGEKTLARLVLDGVGKARRIADLFCGVGPFALRLAEQATVLAVDSDGAALKALDRAARATPELKPPTIEARDLFRKPLTAKELARFDAVIFDPPRAGAEAQARELAAAKVPAVIAVSCDPASFARDAAILVSGGYRIEAVTPIDQFRHAAHVEIVGVFRRG